MLITIDMLTSSYEPFILENRRYWKRGKMIYEARITPLGFVEIKPVTQAMPSADKVV